AGNRPRQGRGEPAPRGFGEGVPGIQMEVRLGGGVRQAERAGGRTAKGGRPRGCAALQGSDFIICWLGLNGDDPPSRSRNGDAVDAAPGGSFAVTAARQETGSQEG